MIRHLHRGSEQLMLQLLKVPMKQLTGGLVLYSNCCLQVKLCFIRKLLTTVLYVLSVAEVVFGQVQPCSAGGCWARLLLANDSYFAVNVSYLATSKAVYLSGNSPVNHRELKLLCWIFWTVTSEVKATETVCSNRKHLIGCPRMRSDLSTFLYHFPGNDKL